MVFVVVGRSKSYYGDDGRYTDGASFKDHVLKQHVMDRERFVFVPWMTPAQLSALFSITTVHMYLSKSFVLSWSLFNALSCGALVLCASSPIVDEVLQGTGAAIIEDAGREDGFVSRALDILSNPHESDGVRRAARALVVDEYSLPVCGQRIRRILENAIDAERSARSKAPAVSV